MEKLVASANGKGKERAEWSEEDLDIANLVRLEGGPRLLYALSKSEGLASRSTLRRRQPIPELLSSVGTPTVDEIGRNIASLLGERARPLPEFLGAGQILMIDDVALEEVPRYDGARNCVLGLCREHLANLDTTVNSIEDVRRLEELLTSGKCHCGKEGTVVAIAPVTGYNFYSPSPLVLSGTCKAEDGKTSAVWIERVLTAYKSHKFGEARHGPIVAIATDGASQFRTMRFTLCHSHELDGSSDLGRIIYSLKGMNRRTGPTGILGTCDVKHILKRFATRLRSEKGVQAHTSHILPTHILDVLQKVKGMPEAKARMLLNPTDKQNVPAAVNLLQTLLELRKCSVDGSPSLRAKVDGINFIAEVLGHFLLPFITADMSLSKQIRHLSTYSHLITALYRKHKSGFLTNQLYADSQAIVKNIIYTTARLQLLNKAIPYYILLEGTDRLEGVFSHARTQDHSSNFDILQLSHKLSIGAEINAIYARRPHLHRGHRRLNLTNAKGIDHINPRSWRGNVNVNDIKISQEYYAGRQDALAILERKFGRNHSIDFDAIFGAPNSDHLQPFGEYVGVNYTDPEGDDEEESAGTSDSVDESPNPDASTGREDEVTERELDGSLFGDDGVTVPIPDSELDPLDCESVVEPELNCPRAGNTRKPTWIEVDGKKINKHTLIATRLTSTSTAAHKVTHRFFRVRGDTTEALLFGKRKGKEVQGTLGAKDTDTSVSSGDPGVILVRTGTHISLAVAEALSFRHGTSKTSVGSIPYSELHDDKKKVTIALQFLELKPSVGEDGSIPRWVWTGNYLKISNPPGTEPLTPKHIALRTSSQHFFPITPERTDSGTWSFDHQALLKAQNDAWDDLDPHEEGILTRVDSLPQVDGVVAQLPLQHPNTHSPALPPSLHILNPPINLSAEKRAGDDKISCKLCPDRKKLSEMRNHVGFHILKAHREVPDPTIIEGVEIGEFPCGWCGIEGCTTEIVIRPKRAPSISSNCEYHYPNMQYGRATVSNKTTASTNVPIQCTLCPRLSTGQHPTIWKYNFWNHMSIYHVDEASGELVQCPPELLEIVRVRKYEEALIGIGLDYTEEFRGTYGILPTSDPPSDAPPVEEAHPTDSPQASEADLQLLAPGFSFVVGNTDESRKRSHSDLSVSSIASARQPPASKHVRLDD